MTAQDAAVEESPDDFKSDLGNLRAFSNERNWCVWLASGELYGPFDTCEPVIDILMQRPGGWGYFFDLVWVEGHLFWTAAFCLIYPDTPLPMQARPLFDPIVPVVENSVIVNREAVLGS